jgi:hypothetical protein
MTTITVDRAVLEQVLEALVTAEAGLADIGDADREQGDDVAWCEARAAAALEGPRAAITALRDALAQPLPDPVDEYRKGFIDGQIDMRDRPEEQEPVAWTDRELQLIDGMIEVQLHHAAQCDGIANRTMAEKQKGWDMERVALLQKIKSNPPRREWQSLSEEEINELSHTMVKGHKSVNWLARAIEAKLKERNNG